MSRTIWVGAVAYDPKVVTIWEGMRRYFHEEAHLPVEVVLFQSYEAQVYALLAGSGDHAPRIDIAWNTNLAYLQADAWSGHRCRPIAMRDTDLGWMTKIVAVSGGPVAALADLRNRTLALGSRDSGHAAILPVHFLEREGLVEAARLPHAALQQRRRQAWRYRHERGRGRSRRPRRPRRCRRDRQPVLEDGAQRSVWCRRARCARSGLRRPTITACSRRGPISTRRWRRSSPRRCPAMSYDNPSHRPVLEAEGLRRWVAPQLDGYGSLRDAAGGRGSSSVRSRSRPEERGAGCEALFA